MSDAGEVLQAGGITSAQIQSEPVVDDERHVTFTLKAQDAERVQVVPMGDDNGMGAGPYDMARGEEGDWTVTIGPVRPGFHYYVLKVDGAECLNPGSEVYWGWARVTNGLDVPDPDLDFFCPKDVPHGDVRLHYYRSQITGALRRIVVYTPPGYDAGPDARYPVLYLQHGSGESERGWTWQGKANFILDNLLAEGGAAPMIVVMENGYAAAPGTPNPGRPPRGENLFERLVVEELVPHIDSTFRTLPDRDHRAIAGLSMGGGQAARIGFGNLDLFTSIGCMSSGGVTTDTETPVGRALQNVEEVNARLRLLWIGCGTEDRLHERSAASHEVLTKAGVEHVWFECDGAHEWQAWRKHLRELAQLLFRD